MYQIKKIISHDEVIRTTNCMYSIKNNFKLPDNENVSFCIKEKVSDQKMMDLEKRQDLLLEKLEILYERIKSISVHCPTEKNQTTSKLITAIPTPTEVVLTASPDNLPFFLNLLMKSNLSVNISWHIHSSVPKEKVNKIKDFVKKIKNNKFSSINFRLIFKSDATDSELKISTLEMPLMGTVNILRYLALVYPSIILYNQDDIIVDSLLDICHQLSKSSEKNKEVICNKLFLNYTKWINGNEFSIVDVAAYNIIKQWKNTPKYIPRPWVDQCKKIFE